MDLVSAASQYKDVVALVAGGGGGALALWRYWGEQNWKRKQFAYDYAERMLADDRAMSALRMLDWTNGRFSRAVIDEFELAEDELDWDDALVARALRPHHPTAAEPEGAAYPPAEYAIRSLFDHALTYFERLGEFLRTGVIGRRDFPNTLAYYVTLLDEPRLASLRGPLLSYLETYRYSSTLFLFRKLMAKPA